MDYYKKKLQEDKEFGILQENEKKNIIDQYFACNSVKLSEHHCYDFYDKKTQTYYEIKSRKNAYNSYPDTVVGYNKIEYIPSRPGRLFYFIFNFTDGLYYIKYEQKLFDTFIVKKFGRWDRGKYEIKDHIFIPIKYLTKLTNP